MWAVIFFSARTRLSLGPLDHQPISGFKKSFVYKLWTLPAAGSMGPHCCAHRLFLGWEGLTPGEKLLSPSGEAQHKSEF